eukprot:GHVS01100397.1.p1 GENE.GHVS01100397.1~~GHVS01100397.1.p1  ORF type:complete len:125 (-),score=1.69 GHVS01100397.1:63-437(-)
MFFSAFWKYGIQKQSTFLGADTGRHLFTCIDFPTSTTTTNSELHEPDTSITISPTVRTIISTTSTAGSPTCWCRNSSLERNKSRDVRRPLELKPYLATWLATVNNQRISRRYVQKGTCLGNGRT